MQGLPTAPAVTPPRHRLRPLLALAPIVLLGVAAWVIHRELAAFHYRDVGEALAALPRTRVALAIALTAASYLVLTGYDVLGLHHLRKPLPYAVVGPTAFIGYTFGHNVGAAFLSGGGLRYRVYSAHGLGALDVTQLMAFGALTFGVGAAFVGGLALAVGVPLPVTVSSGASRVIGVALLAAVAGYVATPPRLRRPIRAGGLAFAWPRRRIAALQVALSTADWVFAALVLWVLLPPRAGVAFASFLPLFVVGQLAGLLSGVPGGLGVFESIVLATLTPAVPGPAALGVLILYRAVYYLLPFVAGALLLGAQEAIRRRVQLARASRFAHGSLAPAIPMVAAMACLVAGAVLLFSGATPELGERLHFVRRVLPLPLLEASHLLGSLTGMTLLLVAHALYRRIDAAWVAAVALLAAGAVFSLAKGWDYEEALVLAALALALLPFRRQFYRHGSLLGERFGYSWIAAVVVVTGASIWLGLFSYRHVDYSHELWWQFARKADAPRFLRATVASLTLALAVGIAHLLRPVRVRSSAPGPQELAAARAIIARSPDSAGHLALLRDKTLLFDDARTAFLMYGVSGRSWIAMGDPIGPADAGTELAWRFRELADRHDGWAAFYQVSAATLPRYLDLGLALIKLGEEASVSLPEFALDQPGRRALRQAHARAGRDGLAFEIVAREGVPAIMAELEAISEAWLASKSTREKGFSLGFFSPEYLAECPIALVRLAGRPIAFANLWAPSQAREELSIDLMRHDPAAPGSTMDFMFVEVMLWGRAQGYQRFNLGMAPFSGLRDRALAPLWSRIGARLFRYGEHFYNFQGLRHYKEKFAPDWSPRYLAAPSGLALPRVVAGVAALVSRGISGTVRR
ncbi:MAG TPA: bifunctional lysylphosphatidylglycerol flippase/synthetase MprF [Anaeromyxobacteraceae bacterium]|nr:bifunctional lysylphosphatidylglycerol flippase/synthetase MprF [Anaeromyxobacteraceae bacterium]